MADNITLDAGSGGAVMATDDISGVHYQLIKLGYGALDAFTIVTASAGLPVAQQGTWTVTGTGGTFPVTDSGGSLTVDAPVGTPVFVRLSDGSSPISTLPVSAASLPLPTGAATEAKQPALGTAGTASTDVLTVQGIASMTALKVDGSAVTQPVSGTFYQATQPVSIAATVTVTGAGGTFPVTDNSGSLTVDAPVGTPVFVRLSDGAAAITTLPVSMAAVPTGASTAAKQPALGTAGSASSDVITVQGIASMTALKVDGSGVTQPVSGTFWQATQPVSVSSVPSHDVTNAGTFAVQVTGAALTSLQLIDDVVFAEDIAHTTGDKGVMPLSVRKDTATALADADGDYQPLTTDGSGRLHVNVGNSVTVGTVTAVTTVTSLTQFNGNAIDTNSGNKSAGTLRVVLATDQPPLTNKLLVTPDLPSGASTAAKQPAIGTAGTASADVITIQGIASMTKLLVTPDANSAVNVAQINGVTPLMGNGATGTGALRVSIANDSTGIVNPGNTANTTPWLVSDRPATSGGLSVSRVIDFSGSNQGQTSIKGSAGQVYGIIATNTNAAVRYLKIYNASAPTSASTPVLTIAIPGNTAGAGVVMNFDKGIAFGTAIGMRATTGAADNDANAVAANEVMANILYN